MRIRTCEPVETEILMKLFRDSVHAIAVHDFGPEELWAWAPATLDRMAWHRRLARNLSLVADDAGRPVGFAELTIAGHIDMLFVDKDRQRRGIASALLCAVESAARGRGVRCLTVDASRTARAFFEARGFAITRRQFVIRSGVRLENFRMEKGL